MGRVDDRTILITGAAQGLGGTYARALAGEGARVSICDVRDPAPLVAEINAAGGRAMGSVVDVTQPEAVAHWVARSEAEFGPPTVLINNAAWAGEGTPKSFMEISSAEWERVMSINARGFFECAKAVVPLMRQRKYGKIVNISSGTFFSGIPGRLHYVASKGAIVGFTRALAREVGEDGICVNCIAPGLTLSDNIRGKLAVLQAAREMEIKARAFKRDQMPEDLVGAVIYFSSAASDFVTGQVLVVDGGMVMY
jgi:NAD(P)-dependent dehydrogenase (short-subunit alcohol dehydrogenase family)